MTSDEWRRAADPGRRIGSRVEHHATIASTNDRAWQLLADGQPDGLAVVADLQTAGRGRRGRAWSSPAGVNLMTSVALRPRLPAARAGLLGIAAAPAVRDACSSLVPGADLLVKWPNDVVTPDGRKMAGLLLETRLDGAELAEAVIGMGINVNWRAADMPPELANRAASLCDQAGSEVSRVALLAALLAALDRELAALEHGDSPIDRLGAVSALEGRDVSIDLGERLVEGRVVGYTDEGLLQLDTDSGLQTLAIGEVVAVRGLERVPG